MFLTDSINPSVIEFHARIPIPCDHMSLLLSPESGFFKTWKLSNINWRKRIYLQDFFFKECYWFIFIIRSVLLILTVTAPFFCTFCPPVRCHCRSMTANVWQRAALILTWSFSFTWHDYMPFRSTSRSDSSLIWQTQLTIRFVCLYRPEKVWFESHLQNNILSLSLHPAWQSECGLFCLSANICFFNKNNDIDDDIIWCVSSALLQHMFMLLKTRIAPPLKYCT